MCDKKVSVYVRNRADINPVEITVTCGDVFGNGYSTHAALCPACLAQAEKDYPQNWNITPGDRCEHGTDISGDRDCACPQCESE